MSESTDPNTPTPSDAAVDTGDASAIDTAVDSAAAVTSVTEDAADTDAAQDEPVEEATVSLSMLSCLSNNNPADGEDEDDDEIEQNEFLSLLPKCVLPRLEKLKLLHEAREGILEEYQKERAILEAKFSKKMKPLYEERRRIVVGEKDEEIRKEVDSKKGGNEEAEKEKEGVVEDVVSDEEEGENEENVKGIPQFWACAIGHVDVIAELITEADVDCLDFLMDVTCEDFPDGMGFELQFHFSPDNPYFTNTILTKRYEVPNLLTEDEPILKNVTGTTIDWKKGKSLTNKAVTKKQRKKGGRGAGQIRTVTKQERTDSFFHFFTPPKMPKFSDVMDEEEADAVEEAFDFDYDVAQAFRGHLIPKGVLWFTGEAADAFDEDLLDGMMGDNDDDDDDEEGGAEGFTFNSGAPNASPFPPPAPGNGENPECKQN